LKIVAGDIGGTHARFALAELRPGERPLVGEMRRYRTREHSGLPSAWRAFARDCGGSLPDAAALGIAAPIDSEILRFINSDWTIDRRRIASDLGLSQMTLLNDYGAVAHAVSVLNSDELEPITGPAANLCETGVITIAGPGTGLGVSILLRRGDRIEVIETDSAHIGFAPLNPEEQAIADDLQERYGRASVERVVAGPGLIEIYRIMGGGNWDVGDAGGLWSAALAGADPIAAQSLEMFVKCFGSVAGDIVLAHGSGALVLTGGLANRMKDKLRSPLFGGRFIAKGRYRARMERIPVLLANYEEPGLLGAAIAFMREHLPESE
jgi:glucokinase